MARRSDAAHNHEKLLSSARTLFMRAGVTVPLEDIARDAGVSIGTLYNHFSNRDELLQAVLPGVAVAQRDRICSAANSGGSARQRLRRYLDALFAVQREDRLLSDVMAGSAEMVVDAHSACRDVVELGARLVDEARHAGVDTVFANRRQLAAVVQANSVVQRSGAPDGWDEFLTDLTLRISGPGCADE